MFVNPVCRRTTIPRMVASGAKLCNARTAPLATLPPLFPSCFHRSRLCLSNTLRRSFSTNRQSEKAREAMGSNPQTSSSSLKEMLKRFLGHKEMPQRYTPAWYREVTLICTVFAITGSSTMILVRPAVSNVLGLQGSFKEGPWSYRICSLVIMTPVYASLLVVVGTLFGRHAYFRHFSIKMFSRFGIPPEALDKNFHETAKTFRKW